MHKRFQALLQGVHERGKSARIADRTELSRRWPFRSGQGVNWIKDRIGRQAGSAELSDRRGFESSGQAFIPFKGNLASAMA